MTKLTAPCYSEEAHGRVGSVVYRSHRGVAIASAKAAAASSHSPAVNSRLAHLNKGSRRWRNLSFSIRSSWNAYARNPALRRRRSYCNDRTGYNWFCSCFVHLALADHPPRDNPPDDLCLGTLAAIDATQVGTDIRLLYDYSTLPDPGILSIEVYRAGPFSRGRNARLKDAVRTIHDEVGPHIDVPTTGQPGAYTLFARLIDRQGLASTWLSATIDME